MTNQDRLWAATNALVSNLTPGQACAIGAAAVLEWEYRDPFTFQVMDMPWHLWQACAMKVAAIEGGLDDLEATIPYDLGSQIGYLLDDCADTATACTTVEHLVRNWRGTLLELVLAAIELVSS